MMKHRGSRFVAGIVLVVAAAHAACAAQPTALLFPGDKRLDTPLTVQRGRVYLGELLDELSSQGRVPLSVVDTRGPVDGNQLTIYVKERPLRDLMEAVRDLFSTPFDAWEWRPASEARKGYVLHHQRSPEAASYAAKQAILARWSADVRTYHEIAHLPPDLQAARAAQRKDLFPAGKVEGGRLQLFGKLTLAQVDAILQGAQITLDPSRLTDEDQAALHFTYGGTRTGMTIPRALPPGFWVGWNEIAMGPILWLRGDDNGSVSVVGGAPWDDGWFRSQAEAWRYTSDPEVLDFLMAQLEQRPGLGGPTADHTIPDWVKRAAQKQDLNLMVDLVYPHFHHTIGAGWIGTTPRETCLSLVLRGDLTWREKKEGQIQLFREKSAVMHPRRHLLPWKQVKALRQAVDHNGGEPGMDQLLQFSVLTPDQLNGLQEEFPLITDLPDWRPLLEFYANLGRASQAALRTQEGVRLRDTGLVARAALAEGPDPQQVRNLPLLQEHLDQARVSLRVEAGLAPDPADPVHQKPGHRLVWEVTVPNLPQHLRSLFLQPRQPLKPD